MRVQLRAAFARLTEIGPTGAKFAPPEQQIPAPPSPTLGKDETHQDLIEKPISLQAFIGQIKSFISGDLLEPIVQRIRPDLISIAGNQPADQIEALVYNLASVNVQLGYERLYNAIFGSQLTLLTQANAAGGVAPTFARQAYEQTKAANPLEYGGAFTFEQRIGFLIGSGLLMTDASGNYVLTNYGRGFLKYINDRQLTIVKPL